MNGPTKAAAAAPPRKLVKNATALKWAAKGPRPRLGPASGARTAIKYCRFKSREVGPGRTGSWPFSGGANLRD